MMSEGPGKLSSIGKENLRAACLRDKLENLRIFLALRLRRI